MLGDVAGQEDWCGGRRGRPDRRPERAADGDVRGGGFQFEDERGADVEEDREGALVGGVVEGFERDLVGGRNDKGTSGDRVYFPVVACAIGWFGVYGLTNVGRAASPSPASRALWVGYASAGAVVLLWSGFSLAGRYAALAPGVRLTPWDLAALRYAVALPIGLGDVCGRAGSWPAVAAQRGGGGGGRAVLSAAVVCRVHATRRRRMRR